VRGSDQPVQLRMEPRQGGPGQRAGHAQGLLLRQPAAGFADRRPGAHAPLPRLLQVGSCTWPSLQAQFFGSGKRMAFKPFNACSSGHRACTMSRSDQIPQSGLLEGHCIEITVRLRPNIWPEKALPELESAFKDLGRLMMDVGLRLTEHCDQYVAQHGSPMQPGTLQQILLRSPCPKVGGLHRQSVTLLYLGEDAVSTWLDTYTPRLQGRLLHYFPSGGGTGSGSGDWCAWHQDHGSITGQQHYSPSM
jgi:hypothetical protein